MVQLNWPYTSRFSWAFTRIDQSRSQWQAGEAWTLYIARYFKDLDERQVFQRQRETIQNEARERIRLEQENVERVRLAQTEKLAAELERVNREQAEIEQRRRDEEERINLEIAQQEIEKALHRGSLLEDEYALVEQ